MGVDCDVHDPSRTFDKLDLRGKECIFIRYLEHSKGYVFIAEQVNGSIFELTSWIAIFLENNFLERGDRTSDLYIFEIEEFDTCIAPLQPNPQVEDDHEEFYPSGSERNIQVPQEGPLQSSEPTPILWCHFDVETKVFVLQEEDETV